MTIDNDLINEILKIAYKAVPKKCALDGTKLIEVHDEMGEFLKIKLLNKAHVSGSLPLWKCKCGKFETSNFDSWYAHSNSCNGNDR